MQHGGYNNCSKGVEEDEEELAIIKAFIPVKQVGRRVSEEGFGVCPKTWIRPHGLSAPRAHF